MLQHYYQINEAAGIDINIDAAGNLLINACSVIIENKQLSFEKKVTDLRSLQELTRHFAVKSIIGINLSGKGILQKQIEKTEEINQQNFNLILPNGKIEDFYIQNFISGNHSFVSLIRKSEADKWIKQLKDLHYIPVMLSLGPFPLQNIFAQLNIYSNELLFNGYHILRNEALEWISYKYDIAAISPFPIKIESESINEKLLIAYADAFQIVLNDKVDTISTVVPSLTVLHQKQLSNKKFKVQGFLVLCIFFVLLLINFFLLNGLNTANEKLIEQVSRSVQSTDDLQQISDQIKQNEHLLKMLGWEGGVNKSNLIDQIAAMLPPEVSWREATIDPIDLSASRTQKEIVFSDREIYITGTCERIIPVNEWIARVKTKAWVKNVQLNSYLFNSEKNTGQFTLTINY